MKSSQVPFLPPGIGAVFVSAIIFSLHGQSPQADQNRRLRFTPQGSAISEEPSGSFEVSGKKVPPTPGITEAPAGFDNLTNGFDPQGMAFEQINGSNVKALRSFNDNRFIFEEVEGNADGLGPTYNAQSCRECHQNVVTGGASQIAEHRTGRLEGDAFFESLGGSLIQSRATHPNIVERVAFEDDIRTFRISTNTLGNGFVESIADATLLAIRDAQPPEMRGTALMVPVLEAQSAPRVGRFGWKCQHASLQLFSADAYLNEMGITSPLLPDENSEGMDFRPGGWTMSHALGMEKPWRKKFIRAAFGGRPPSFADRNSGNTPAAPYRSTRRAPCAGAGSRWQSAMPSDVSIAGPEDFWTIA